jgi:hypothetical protein
MKRKHLRWKREPRETGLRAIGAAPPGWRLHDGETEFASVSPLGGAWHNGDVRGWYWVAYEGDGIEWRNTHATPCSTPEEAKAQAKAYIEECLKRRQESAS